MNKLNAVAFGAAGALIALVAMLLLGVLGNLGMYTGAVEMMQAWHMFFSLTIGGIIAGMIEAAVISFVFFWSFAWLYNQIAGRQRS